MSCCAGAPPATVNAEFEFGTYDISATLTYNSSTQKWVGSLDLVNEIGAFCDQVLTITLYCTGTGCSAFRLDLTFSNACASAITGLVPNAGCSCSPLSLTFSLSNFDPCCLGFPVSGTITIT